MLYLSLTYTEAATNVRFSDTFNQMRILYSEKVLSDGYIFSKS